MSDIVFTSAGLYAPGTIAGFLIRSYDQIVNEAPEYWESERQKWVEYDRAVFQEPDTVGRSVVITCADDVAVGFASWDPR